MSVLDVHYWTLARLKAVVLFVGSVLTYATTIPQFHLPTYLTGVSLLLSFVATYAVPNVTVKPDGSADAVPADGSTAADEGIDGQIPQDASGEGPTPDIATGSGG